MCMSDVFSTTFFEKYFLPYRGVHSHKQRNNNVRNDKQTNKFVIFVRRHFKTDILK